MKAAVLRTLRFSMGLRGVAQFVIVGALVIAGVLFGQRIDGLEHKATEQEATTTAIGVMLAQTCGAASFKELREQGLVEECRLAQQGDLDEAIPDDALPDPDAEVDEVDADVIEDDVTSTPADVAPVPNGQVYEAVLAYFVANPLSTQPGYQRAISRTVAAYLTANPPEPGRPPTGREIRDAVRTALLANPPADGEDGQDGSPGVSVTSAALDGCDVVFTYSDGTTSAVGPVCGADGQPGPPPTDEQVAQAVVAYCTSNGECRGPAGPPGVVQTADNCDPPDGEFVTDVNIAGPVGDPATITLSCETSGIIGNGNGPP